MTSLPKDGFAMKRHFFEVDTVFEGEMAPELIRIYEKASEKAAYAAKRAIAGGNMSQIRNAQWLEAVVLTLQEVISALRRTSDTGGDVRQQNEIEIPDAPNFEGAA